jgi:hypothetical protein
VIVVDKNPAYLAAIKELKAEGDIVEAEPDTPMPLLNNIVGQRSSDGKTTNAVGPGYGSFRTA